jgi:hypothetical protein
MKITTCLAAVCATLLLVGTPPLRADELPEKYRAAVHKGLEWLAKQQQRDGSWGANGGQYPVAMTALAGMAMLMEGSTLTQGKYSENIRKAADWLMAKSQKGNQRDGLIGNPDNPSEAARYMYGHGFGMMFLACVYGDENNAQKREKLKDILTRAVKYTINSQSSRGGFYYTSKMEGGDRDEGSVTITQVQALRACRNAGIAVPRQVIKNVYKYLKDCTSPRGHIYYSYQSKQERPAITAAGIACLFNAGEYKDELGKKWLKACKDAIPNRLGAGQPGGIRIGHDEYTHYYYSQSIYILGENGWEKLFGATPENERLTWSKYRDSICDQLVGMQNADGSWSAGGGFSVGPVYSTSMYLAIMQLERGVLPLYQR